MIINTVAGWALNGTPHPALAALEHLDYSFTPATNYSQLRQVPAALGASVSLPAAWIDLEDGSFKALAQTYTRRDAGTVWYESSKTGYSGLLDVASHGFVAHYPALWQAEQTG